MQREPPDDTAPAWIAVLLIAILAVSMFAAGYVLGIRSSAGVLLDEPEPWVGKFRFQADSGIIHPEAD